MSARSGLRSAVARESPPSRAADPTSPVIFEPLPSASSNIRRIPIGSKFPGLSVADTNILRKKQDKLRTTASATLASVADRPHLQNALQSTLIFAQYEAGTAVCIDPGGWILTCAHCFGESKEEYEQSSRRKWLLYYTGLAVEVECQVWDAKRDLALLKVVSIETDNAGDIALFQHVALSSIPPKYRMEIFCIGQPGRDDLESVSGGKTKYNLVEVSEGRYQGMVKGTDPQDNSEIGSMKHNAWTYWGHSGAPLLRKSDGTLIGLHSSWDDETAMRHAVPQVAIQEFLEVEIPVGIRSLLSCVTVEK